MQVHINSESLWEGWAQNKCKELMGDGWIGNFYYWKEFGRIKHLENLETSVHAILDKSGFSRKAEMHYLNSENKLDKSIFYKEEDLVFWVSIDRNNRMSIKGFADSDRLETWKSLIETLPRPQKRKKDEIKMRFWYKGPRGGDYTIRKIKCPEFVHIEDNYPDKVVKKMNTLITMERPDDKGKVIIWHGPPGTGKTYSVRALAREWMTRINASVELVIDPKEMLADTNYMQNVLLEDPVSTDEAHKDWHDAYADNTDPNPQAILDGKYDQELEKEPNVRLIILEDQGELFSIDCKERNGFDKFLNLTDGIIGQGVRMVFLITSNEKIDKIDEAVKRNGRCLNITNFGAMTKEEALDWLERKNIDSKEYEIKDDMVLADLYALTETEEEEELLAEPSVKFGF
jgi:DNA replication protein DnaC